MAKRIMTIWDAPKKEYWELTKTQKDYVEKLSKDKKAYQAAIRRNKRLSVKNKERTKKTKIIPQHERVAIIHWVKDTPHSLAIQFCRWRNQHAKQR